MKTWSRKKKADMRVSVRITEINTNKLNQKGRLTLLNRDVSDEDILSISSGQHDTQTVKYSILLLTGVIILLLTITSLLLKKIKTEEIFLTEICFFCC